MRQTTHLIVNADDFGQSPGINRGIIAAHEQGIVTSASLMVRWPASAEAAEYARTRPQLSLGLHVDLGEWSYRQGDWRPVYTRVDFDNTKKIEEELQAQLALFQVLVSKQPTHLDSHQHIHLRPHLRPMFESCAQALGVPLRSCSNKVNYCGAFYGQTADGIALRQKVTVETMIEILASLPEGTTELACHPGLIRGSEQLKTMYRTEREWELETLCHPKVREAIAARGIRLLSFGRMSMQGLGLAQ